MSLENLVKINKLNPHVSNAVEVGRLLAAARRNVADSAVAGISDETRFDAAYKAIMQCAVVGLYANGYRPSTTTPGHHQTVIQCLEPTMGVAPEVWRVLDALRKKRNLNDYGGDLIEPASLTECIAQAKALLKLTTRWLRANRPELLTDQK
jgi:hypothetical protein